MKKNYKFELSMQWKCYKSDEIKARKLSQTKKLEKKIICVYQIEKSRKIILNYFFCFFFSRNFSV